MLGTLSGLHFHAQEVNSCTTLLLEVVLRQQTMLLDRVFVIQERPMNDWTESVKEILIHLLQVQHLLGKDRLRCTVSLDCTQEKGRILVRVEPHGDLEA